MYSVEDLLISHGYKLPKHSASTPSTPVPTSSSQQAPSSSPPSYIKHIEILENRPGSRTVNGNERGSGFSYGSSGGISQPQAYGGSSPNNNNECRDRSQSNREGEGRIQTDTHSLGESLTSDSGFCDGTRSSQWQPKDVSYWRRRGQDFTVLLDYADFREACGGWQGSYKLDGSQQARGQEVSSVENQRAAQDRQHLGAQVQGQVRAQSGGERDATLHQWKMVAERKCQSLGTDEWRPNVSFGCQLSQNEGEQWAQEQQRFHARTPEGVVVHPKTKAKSQSLPRMLQPDSLQYVDMRSSGQELYRRANGHPVFHHNLYRAPHWPDNGRPASATQLSMTPKTRFTRPPKPPSYEMHQQIRGSCEVLSGRDSAILHERNRTPRPLSRTHHPQLDYFAQDSGPPGYIPPPSYKRAPIMRGRHRGYGEIAVNYRYRGDMYQQIQMAPDGSHWVIRHPASFWTDMQRERSASSQKHLYPVYTQNHPGGGIQYIPFGDPSIRHISSALSGNSLTDADKIRHIRNELPSVTVSEPASDDSAFLPPPLGTFISAKTADDTNQTSSNDFVNDNSRWHGDLHKQTVSNFPANDQNCNNRYPKNYHPFPSSSSAFQAPIRKCSSHQGQSSEQVFTETITHVKKIDPDLGPENNRSTKRRVSETIFCLVSVPVHTPINVIKDSSSDQNNNETISSLTVTKMEKFAVGLKETQNLRSKSVMEMPIRSHYSHFHTSNSSSMRNYKRAPLRKEIIDAWALQARQDKEMCYAGSLPGNQYRNQETQTGSPLTVATSPVTTLGEQSLVQPALHTTRNTAVGTDSTLSYSYPMAGQNNLHPSSNSAFSRLSPAQLPSLQAVEPEMSSPSKVKNQGDQQPLSPRKSISSPPENAEQVAFGQFLLKPMNRRPCDAIDELESINKELQHRIGKRSNLAHCTKDRDEVHKTLDWYQFRVPSHNTAHFTAAPEPGRKAISLLHISKPNIMKVRSESLVSSANLDSLGLKSIMSRPQANITSKNAVSPLPSPGLGDSYLLSSPPSHSMSHRHYKPDIPVPQESLLRNVGLTVYTETPGHPGEPMQRSLSLPSPLDMQAVQLSCKNRRLLVKNRSNPEEGSHEGFQLEKETGKQVNADSIPQFRGDLNFSICKTLSENGSPNSAGSPHTNRLTMETVEDNDGVVESSSVSEPLTFRNESAIADEHPENLLIQEKVIVSQVEDLSNLYEVKSAEGIPDNETIEQRAARILGIAVPAEALCVGDKHTEHSQTDTSTTVADKHSASKETQQVIRQGEQVKKDRLIVQGAEIDEVKETGLGIYYEEDERRKHSSTSCNNVEITHHIQEAQSTVVVDLPEFPPTSLPLSLPVIPKEKLVLSMCIEEKRGQSVASKLIESLPEKISSSSVTPLGRSTPDSIISRKEVESVSSIRHLSHKSSDSEEEADPKERDKEGCRVQEEGKQEVLNKKEKDEDRKLLKETPAEDDEAHGPPIMSTLDMMGDLESNYKCKEEKNLEICKDQQREEETAESTNVEIALNAQSEKSNKEELDVEVELKIVEDDTEKTVEKVSHGQKTEQDCRAEATQDTEGREVPKPKQRTRLRKPPLLPKPCTVSKAEVPVALIFSTGSCGHVEDEEVLSVSDSYDPSRVERV